MLDSDLILSLDQLATWASESGFVDVEQFWTSLSALVTLRQSQSRQAKKKIAALMFHVPPKTFYEWVKAEFKKRGPQALDIVVSTILDAQNKGDIDPERSTMLIRIVNDVRKEQDNS